MAPYEVLRVEIGEGVHEIKKGVFRGCEQMLFLNILSKSITIQTGAFFNCNLLQEVHFHKRGNMNIESGAFDNCENLSVVRWPNVVQWIFDGKFGELTSPKDRPPIPATHKDAFNAFSTAIAEDCERYSYLFYVGIGLSSEKCNATTDKRQIEPVQSLMNKSLNWTVCAMKKCIC